MSVARLPNRRGAQAGFTLVEFMVAGTLGLLLTAGAIQLFIETRSTQHTQDQLAQLRDTGSSALGLLRRQAQRAGWSTTSLSAQDRPINFDDAAHPSANGVGAGGSDRLSINYDLAAGETDCTGDTPANPVLESYSLDAQERLVCESAGRSTVVAEGVEGFQVQYGVDTRAGSALSYRTPGRYFHAAAVPANRRGDVTSLRLALLLRSPAKLPEKPAAASFSLLDAPALDKPADGYLRRSVELTVQLPNARKN